MWGQRSKSEHLPVLLIHCWQAAAEAKKAKEAEEAEPPSQRSSAEILRVAISLSFHFAVFSISQCKSSGF